jgi:positive regulator of sigma E activity
MQEELVEEGIVLNSGNGIVEIQLSENDHCEECSAKLFCNPQKDKSKKLIAEDKNDLQIGDRVTVTIPGKSLFLASVNLYLYPLLILVAAIFVGTELFKGSIHKEIYSFLLSLIMVAFYYAGFFWIGKKLFKYKSSIHVSKMNL